VITRVEFWEDEPVWTDPEDDFVLEAEMMETVLPAAEQVLEKAFKASCVAPPQSF